MLDRDQVIWAYRCFFNREPESEAAIEQHRGYADWNTLRRAFLHSAEFAATGIETPSDNVIGRLSLAPPIQVEAAGDLNELSEMFRRVGQVWKNLGESEPHWSVVTADQFKSDQIEHTQEAFYASGQQDADLIRAYFARNQRSLEKVKTCLEFGCGVGRATSALSGLFSKVYAVDVSASHLRLADEWLRGAGDTNVDLIHLTSILETEKLPSFDLLYSTIVFQHNPPPVIAALLNALFTKISPGGYVLFQVPTYRTGYHFRLRDYLKETHSDMEMHVLSQEDIFRFFRAHGLCVIEVQEDGLTGSHHFRSNTFFAQRGEE